MGLSFSGVGSGLPISDWIEALVKVDQDKIDVLKKQQEGLQKKSSTLSTLKNTYSAVNSSTLKLTDSLHGPASDIFSQVSVSTSDSSIVSASATQLSTPAVIKLKIKQLATQTTRRSFGSDTLGADIFTDTSKKLSELGAVKEGVMTINGAKINISPDMTADSLIYQINNNVEAGVKAHVEDGRLVLTNKDFGNKAVEVVDVNTNFAALTGLNQTDATHTDPEYQVIGKNAIYSINGGADKEATTNKLTSDHTGILGLSVELLSVTSGEEQVTINISRDFKADNALSAMQTFIDNFNKAIGDTDTETAVTGNLYSENSLVSIRNRMRTLATSTINPSGVYKSLSDIGITSGAPGMDITADTTKLTLDKDKFIAAFDANPAAVKQLLIGDGVPGGPNEKGAMQQMQVQLDAALDTQYGYFKARSASLDSQISGMTEKIDKKNDNLIAYQQKLTKQFNYMDQQIAKMNQQFAQMQEQLKTIGVNVGS